MRHPKAPLDGSTKRCRMASSELSKCRRLHSEEFMRADVNARLRMTAPLRCLFVKGVDHEWRHACCKHGAASMHGSCELASSMAGQRY